LWQCGAEFCPIKAYDFNEIWLDRLRAVMQVSEHSAADSCEGTSCTAELPMIVAVHFADVSAPLIVLRQIRLVNTPLGLG
jgi:hypothetical protein